MATRPQIARIQQRIEALAVTAGKQRIVVVGPGESNGLALQRQGFVDSPSSSWVFIHTGVPRPW